jgi:hypothetical protein
LPRADTSEILLALLSLLTIWFAAASALSAPTGDAALARAMLDSWAPVFVQHVSTEAAGRDWPMRVDFDGDWNTINNAERDLSRRAPEAAAYGAAVVTTSHAYLTYVLYYPHDWQTPVCLPYLCHENDLEVVVLVVERSGGSAGRLILVESKAHLAYRPVPRDQVLRNAEGRVVLWVEAEGHGVRACRPGEERCAADDRRLVYTPALRGESPPRRADGRAVGYQLFDLHDTLWARRNPDTNAGLWTAGETGPLWYRGAWRGRAGRVMGVALAGRRSYGSVRPPWGLRAGAGARGDWFLDPAGTMPRLHPAPYAGRAESGIYVAHPYLSDLRAECEAEACDSPSSAPERSRSARWLGEGGVAVLFLVALVRQRRRRERWRARGPRAHRHTTPR